ncbi:MAG TPA: hypothetical protein VJ944_00855 [Thermoplasmataceae archaeon]|nr:hypothetical protein [Thermoplasmataceae archaeon]
MKKSHDLVVIGTGSTTMPATFYCSSNGMSTAVIDSKRLQSNDNPLAGERGIIIHETRS